MFISDNNRTPTSAILRYCVARDMTFHKIHIGFCDITDRNHALQIIVRQGIGSVTTLLFFIMESASSRKSCLVRSAPHGFQFPFTCVPHSANTLRARQTVSVHTLSPIDLTGTPRHVGFGFICPLLDIRIGNRRTDRIRIRFFMSNYIN